MVCARVFVACGFIAVLLGASGAADAQDADPLGKIQQQLQSLYTLTKATADDADIVTAGSVLVLGKDNLLMCRVNRPIPTPNVYKNAAIDQEGLLGALGRMGTAPPPGGGAPKNAAPDPNAVVSSVAAVFKVDSAGAATAAASAPAAAPAAAAQTKTIALGQSRDQVLAMFGQPSKVVQLGAKEIDYYPDMKVTFMQNKVANVE